MGAVHSSQEAPVVESFSDLLKSYKPKTICGWVVLPLQVIIASTLMVVGTLIALILGGLCGLIQNGCRQVIKWTMLACLFCCL